MLIFTSCTNNYIPKARVLASTLKSFHPDWTFCLLLGEKPPEGFNLEKEPFDRLVGFDELNIPNYRSWLFRHRIVEICTAAKGPALNYFLEHENYEKVMYLDPDMMVCNSLAPLATLLDQHDLLLTPHQLTPQKKIREIEDNELSALQHGVFNLGFVAAAQRGDGLAFSRWWRDRLLRYCYDDIPHGLFTDQRWCDLAPAFFSALHVVRDPGCNVASWNLAERTITRAEDGNFLANGKPLRFYHFTGFDSGVGDDMTTRYAMHMPAVHELWKLYRERLSAAGQSALGKQRWSFTTFTDGTLITDEMRLLYRKREELQKIFPDPFIRPGYLEWYRRNRYLPVRVINKAYGIVRRTKKLLDRHGGFPRGIPGFARQITLWLRRWGAKGIFTRIWQTQPIIASETIQQPTPSLADVLNTVESPYYQTLQRLLKAEHQPVLILEHDWGGGADAYCRKLTHTLLEEKKAVINLRGRRNALIFELNIHYGRETLSLQLDNIKELADERFPRIFTVIVNEMAGWFFWGYNNAGAYPLDNTIEHIEEAVRDLEQMINIHQPKLDVLFHDFFMICPTINLLNEQTDYCGVPEDDHICDTCALRGKPFSMKQWRTTWQNLLSRANEIVFFSENSQMLARKVMRLRDEQIRVKPHNVIPFGTQLVIPANTPMRIAVVGDIHIHKGADIVLALAHLLAKKLPEASIVVIGQLLAGHIPSNVEVLGPYAHEDLPLLLKKHQVTIGLFPSICPETFSFVVRELASLGLPLVSFDLGAQGEFVATLPNGRLAREISAEAALDSLLALDAETRSALPPRHHHTLDPY